MTATELLAFARQKRPGVDISVTHSIQTGGYQTVFLTIHGNGEEKRIVESIYRYGFGDEAAMRAAVAAIERDEWEYNPRGDQQLPPEARGL